MARSSSGFAIPAVPMSDVTYILSAIEQGDPRAADQLLPLVYDELRKLAVQKLAHENPGQTQQATALVHEAYVRLVANVSGELSERQSWDSKRHFFASAAEAVRRILVDAARNEEPKSMAADCTGSMPVQSRSLRPSRTRTLWHSTKHSTRSLSSIP